MRGQIDNRDRRKQIIDYSGLRYKNITPTDIDGVCEFLQTAGFFEIRNKVFIFVDPKLKDTPIKRGQQLAFERIVDAISKPAIYIIADHEVHDTDEDILAHECVVREYYSSGEWLRPQRQIKLKELIDAFLIHNKLEEYIDNDIDW